MMQPSMADVILVGVPRLVFRLCTLSLLAVYMRLPTTSTGDFLGNRLSKRVA